MPDTLDVVVVNWNTRDALHACLAELTKASRADWMRVICVDNGSTDGSPAMVSQEFPTVELIRSEENLGFPRGANLGMSIALERHAPRYIALVNSDVIVSPDVLGALVAHLDAHPAVAAVAPRLRHPNGTLQTGAAGFAPTAWTGVAHFLFVVALTRGWCRGVFVNQRHYADRRAAEPVDWVTGACPVLRSEVLRGVGLLDGRFFMYADDIDWCCRARRAGWSIHYLPTVEAVHSQGVTTPTPNPKWLASLCELVRRDRGAGEYLVFRLAAAFGLAVRALAYALAYALTRQPQYRERAHAMRTYARWAFRLREMSVEAPGELRADR